MCSSGGCVVRRATCASACVSFFPCLSMAAHLLIMVTDGCRLLFMPSPLEGC